MASLSPPPPFSKYHFCTLPDGLTGSFCLPGHFLPWSWSSIDAIQAPSMSRQILSLWKHGFVVVCSVWLLAPGSFPSLSLSTPTWHSHLFQMYQTCSSHRPFTPTILHLCNSDFPVVHKFSPSLHSRILFRKHFLDCSSPLFSLFKILIAVATSWKYDIHVYRPSIPARIWMPRGQREHQWTPAT